MSRNRIPQAESEGFNLWQSYSDMMAALLLLFVLIMSSSLILYRNSYEDHIKEKELAAAELEEKADRIKEQEELLSNQQKQLDQLIGIKEEIIQSLSEKLKKTELSVMVDPNDGSITFDSSILFSVDSYELTEEGMVFLEAFIPVYFNALLSSEYQEYISEIIIEGHTDTDGSYMYNLDLSQKRALSVSQYCLEHTESFLNSNINLERFQKILTANGRSYSSPVLDAGGNIDKDASRRVEFKFRLKDDEMITQIKGILEHE